MDAHAVELLATAAVDLQNLEAGRDEPDVIHCYIGELYAPLHGDADTAEKGVELVAAVLAAVEAEVGVLPHAVDTVGSFRLSQDVLKQDL